MAMLGPRHDAGTLKVAATHPIESEPALEIYRCCVMTLAQALLELQEVSSLSLNLRSHSTDVGVKDLAQALCKLQQVSSLSPNLKSSST